MDATEEVGGAASTMLGEADNVPRREETQYEDVYPPADPAASLEATRPPPGNAPMPSIGRKPETFMDTVTRAWDAVSNPWVGLGGGLAKGVIEGFTPLGLGSVALNAARALGGGGRESLTPPPRGRQRGPLAQFQERRARYADASSRLVDLNDPGSLSPRVTPPGPGGGESRARRPSTALRL